MSVSWELVTLAWTTLGAVVGSWIHMSVLVARSQERIRALEHRVRTLELSRVR